MTTVTNNFNRYLASVTSATTTGVLPTAVASGTDIVVTGLVVCNTHATNPVSVNIKIDKSGTQYYILKANQIPVSEALIAIGWDQKVVLKPGDNIIVQCVNAGETADVSLSTLEITTA